MGKQKAESRRRKANCKLQIAKGKLENEKAKGSRSGAIAAIEYGMADLNSELRTYHSELTPGALPLAGTRS